MKGFTHTELLHLADMEEVWTSNRAGLSPRRSRSLRSQQHQAELSPDRSFCSGRRLKAPGGLSLGQTRQGPPGLLSRSSGHRQSSTCEEEQQEILQPFLCCFHPFLSSTGGIVACISEASHDVQRFPSSHILSFILLRHSFLRLLLPPVAAGRKSGCLFFSALFPSSFPPPSSLVLVLVFQLGALLWDWQIYG